MKKVVLSLLFLFLLSSVSAAIIQITPNTDVIIPEFINQQANFTLFSDNIIPAYYQAYSLTDVSVSPKGFFSVPNSAPFPIYIYPTANLKERGFYAFTLFLKPEKGDTVSTNLTVNVVPLKDALSLTSDYIDPNNAKATFYLKSNVNARLSGIRAHFTSVFFDETQTINLEPFQKLEINVDANPEKMTSLPAGPYNVTTEFYTDNGTYAIEGTILLGEKNSITTTDTSSGWLINERTITKANSGNVPTIAEITIQKNIILRLFTTFNEDPTLVERNGLSVKYTWNRRLDISTSFKVVSKTNLIFPFLLVILAAILILGFARYSKEKVEIRKSVSYVKTRGGEFALKIKLRIIAKHAVQNASLMDKIPGILNVYEKAVGSSFKLDSLNRRITWQLGNLNAGEVREFSYVVYAKVGVVGRFGLPPALVVFEQNNRVHEVESNEVFFLSEQISKEEF